MRQCLVISYTCYEVSFEAARLATLCFRTFLPHLETRPFADFDAPAVRCSYKYSVPVVVDIRSLTRVTKSYLYLSALGTTP